MSFAGMFNTRRAQTTDTWSPGRRTFCTLVPSEYIFLHVMAPTFLKIFNPKLTLYLRLRRSWL